METYHLPQGFDLAVDYGRGKSGMQISRSGRDARITERFRLRPTRESKCRNFSLDLVPDSMRGKELGFAGTIGRVD